MTATRERVPSAPDVPETEADIRELEKVASAALNGATKATFAALQAKPRRTMTFTVNTLDQDGAEVALSVKYRAISSKAYDALMEAHPPTAEQKKANQVYNVDTFAPALISAVSCEPTLSYEQAKEIYDSPDWSGGELSSLFIKAMQVCNSGLDVPFNARD
jgi:hypothetical protein